MTVQLSSRKCSPVPTYGRMVDVSNKYSWDVKPKETRSE